MKHICAVLIIAAVLLVAFTVADCSPSGAEQTAFPKPFVASGACCGVCWNGQVQGCPGCSCTGLSVNCCFGASAASQKHVSDRVLADTLGNYLARIKDVLHHSQCKCAITIDELVSCSWKMTKNETSTLQRVVRNSANSSCDYIACAAAIARCWDPCHSFKDPKCIECLGALYNQCSSCFQ